MVSIMFLLGLAMIVGAVAGLAGPFWALAVAGILFILAAVFTRAEALKNPRREK